MTLEHGGSRPGSASVPVTESTATLISRVKSGDREAREQLIARFLPVLKRWAHGRLPARARGLVETGDLVQLTLVRVVNRLGSIESQREGAFLAYLRRTLINQLRNEIRRSAREHLPVDPDSLPDDRRSLLEEMVGRRVIDAYETALASLPEPLQEAIILSVEFGYSHRQLAEAIGSPSPNAARMTVSRALIRLSGAMERSG
jgi:RNA polymerase sigma-70 factor (ECF subfamily)